MEELFTMTQVATKLKLHRKTVAKFVKNGQLRSMRIGGSIRIQQSALEEFIRASEQPSPITEPQNA